jgi:hypothetical protein
MKDREWKTKFNELPLLVKIVVTWVYFMSILNFLKFFEALIMQLSIDAFSLAFGYLIWELASSLVERSNFARVITIIWSGLNGLLRIYLVWNGGTIFIEDLKLSGSYASSIIVIIMSCS